MVGPRMIALIHKVLKILPDKAQKLLNKQNALADLNRKQEALANLESDFKGLKPDIALICERLVLFAEIWSSVRFRVFSDIFRLLILVL